MPRREPRLIKLLKKGLNENMKNISKGLDPKYRNLIWKDYHKKVFILNLPHKGARLDEKDELFLKDYYALNPDNPYEYSAAKSNVTNSLKKSVYVDRVPPKNKLAYRMLNGEEVKEKRRRKTPKKEQKDDKIEALSDSGFDSELNSPENCKNDSVLGSINHDHLYVPPEREDSFQYDCTVPMHIDEIPRPSARSLPFEKDNYYEGNSNIMELEDFGNFSGLPEDATLEALENIPNEQLIYSKESHLPQQDHGLIDAAAKRRQTYICEKYKFLGKSALVLICKLLPLKNADIANSTRSDFIQNNISIVCEEGVLKMIQGYIWMQDWKIIHIDDHYFLFYLELPSVNQRVIERVSY